MRSLALVVTGLALGLTWACGGATFGCQDDSQCADGSVEGFCEASGFCSFPDAECDSGNRYGQFAPGELAGACVPSGEGGTGGAATASTTGSSTSTSAASSSTTLTSSTSSTTGPSSSSTTEPVDESASDSTGDPTTGPDATTGSTVEMLTFVDEFERADSTDVGNGWIEKNGDAFQLQGGQVVFQSAANGYGNNVVYRPFSESMLDVEVIAELVFSDTAPPGHPQVHARLQSDDIGQTGSVTCYILFIEDGNQLQVTRQESGTFADQVSDAIQTPQVGETYRLRLRVTGTDPVNIDGYLERFDGSDWVEEGHVGYQDSDPTRIADPGTVAFSGHTELDHYDYERFTADEL